MEKKIDEDREKSRTKFADYLNKYTCSTKNEFLNKIQVKYNKSKDIHYGDMDTKKKIELIKLKMQLI